MSEWISKMQLADRTGQENSKQEPLFDIPWFSPVGKEMLPAEPVRTKSEGPASAERDSFKMAGEKTEETEKSEKAKETSKTEGAKGSEETDSAMVFETADLDSNPSGKESEMQERSRPVLKADAQGLVLGGGGAKGCYHVGAWQAMKEMGISYQGVSGTSIGALVGSFYVQQNIEPVTDFVMGMTPTEIARDLPKLPTTVKETVKGAKTILEFIVKYKDDKMDITPLKNHFDELFDYETFAGSDIAYGCMTFNDTRQEGRSFTKEQITPQNAKDIIMASAACYPAFPKVEFEGEIYMDGGFADNVPIDLLEAIMPGIADENITVIDLHGPSERKPASLKPGMRYIQPLLDPGSPIDFSRDHAQKLYRQGYLETRKYFGRNPGYLYTFLPEDASLIEVMENYLDSSMEQHEIQLPEVEEAGLDALRFGLGYRPYPMDNPMVERYEYGQLIEALALLAKVEPRALYDYRTFLKLIVSNLNELRLTNVPAEDFKVVEMFSNLKREELTVQLHKYLVHNNGQMPLAAQKIKDKIAPSYTLAYVWYFLEELVKNLS